MANPLPSYEKLHQLFEEREPGIIYWKVQQSSRALIGSLAGTRLGNGYHMVTIDGWRFVRHRIIWKMHTGNDPIGTLDHIQGKDTGDHFENLRDVTDSENSRDGRRFIVRGWAQGRYNNYDVLSFSTTIWPDEDIDGIQNELEAAIEPIINKIFNSRFGRKRPKSE